MLQRGSKLKKGMGHSQSQVFYGACVERRLYHYLIQLHRILNEPADLSSWVLFYFYFPF